MLNLESFNADITQMGVDFLVCPIIKDLTPAYKIGEAIFTAAGYAQLQKSILDDGRSLHVSGFSVLPFQRKTKTLFLLKVSECIPGKTLG